MDDGDDDTDKQRELGQQQAAGVLASLQDRYHAILQQLQEEEEKESVMRAKLKSHTEQRQFAERQVQVQRQRQQQQMRRAPTSSSPIAPGGGSSGNGNGTGTGGGGDLRTHAWPERMQSSADFSKQSLAALSAYVDQLEAQAHSDAVRRATNSFGRGGDDGGGGGRALSSASAAANNPTDGGGSPSLRLLDYTDINRELERTVVVTFMGTSSVQVPVDDTTTFADVLEEALRYFSLPPTGALLMDLQNCAWPLGKRVLAFFATDLTPPFVKLVQRRHAILPLDAADIVDREADDDNDADWFNGRGGGGGGIDDAEKQRLLQSDSAGVNPAGGAAGGPTTSRPVDRLAVCGYVLLFLQLAQLAAFLALALLFNPVARLGAVQGVVDRLLFSSTAFDASAATSGVVDDFDAITTPAQFWLWLQGPFQDQFANGSLVPTNYSDICELSTAFPNYVGNDTTGHYCVDSGATTAEAICAGTAAGAGACQIMRGTTTCPQWETLEVCTASFGAFALNTYNVIMGPARLVQHLSLIHI